MGWKTVSPAGPRSPVSRLVAVHKLKEIMVLTGFRRANGETVTPPDITGESDWRPAIELYGEGLFFTLDESLLQRWEANPTLASRTTAFKQRYPSAPLRTDVEITSRFLLCHTLAHLMIRQIEATAGYPAASLKERIYCSNGAEPMAGVLIYVAVPDAQGSLGGVHGAGIPGTLPALAHGGLRGGAVVLARPGVAGSRRATGRGC